MRLWSPQLVFALVVLTVSCGSESGSPTGPSSALVIGGPFAAELVAFDAQDTTNPYRTGGVVFLGSSSIRFWDLDRSFPGRDYLNRGFGGSQISDALEYLDLLVLRHEPAVVVFYAGDNDIAAGKKPARVAADFEMLVARLHARMPSTRVLFLAIKPSLARLSLLEAMQEHRVTVQGRTYTLEEPFFVFATQNPIELEGTYPLPEAQLDRFMFHIVIKHPPEDEELEVVRSTTRGGEPEFNRAVTGEDLVKFQQLVRKVPVSEPVMRYALSLVRTSRLKGDDAPEFTNKWVAYGASVRAAQYLILGGKARALTQGRYHVSFEDIRALAHPVLRHRILLNFHAESEGITSDQIIDQLLEAVPVPVSQM